MATATYTFGDATKSVSQKKPTDGTTPAAASASPYTFGMASQNVSVAPPEPKDRGAFGKVAHFLAPTATESFEKVQKGENLSARDVIGSALEVGSFLIPAGAGARVLGLGAKGAALTLGRRAAIGAVSGGLAGATYGAGNAIGTGEDLGGVASRALLGGTIGAATGGAIPLAARGASKAFGAVKQPFVSRATEKAEQASLLKSKVPDTRIATKVLEKGKVVTDKVAKEAVKQGIPEADVALVKAASKSDRVKMGKMLDTRLAGLTNKRYAAVNRSTDVVGNTFVERIAKPIEKLNKDAAKRLDQVANRLAGKKIDPTSAVTSFADELKNLGVTVKKNGALNFKDSAFEGLGSVQSNINNVWSRAIRIAKTKDALQAHRAKTFIDQVVEYGAEGSGLKGKASTLLKQFRHNLDGELDTKFAAYNKVNTQFADSIATLQKMAEAIGKKSFKLHDTFVDANSGTAMRRLFSNTQSRTKILGMLDESQKVLKKYGIKLDEDIISQSAFADMLEGKLGSEAPTSLLGQFSKGLESFGSTAGIEGVQQVGSAASEFARGNLVRGTLKLGTQTVDAIRGINQENMIKALQQLLKEKPSTVFGRVRK